VELAGRLSGDLDALDEMAHALRQVQQRQPLLPDRLNADPESVERGLAQLVLTLVDLLRQLLERQALRRIEAGSVTEAEIERMGQTFMRLEARMAELKELFGLRDEDLNLDLGPLGHLLPKE
jgi:hypothetical protein